jgi:hypothetical protein
VTVGEVIAALQQLPHDLPVITDRGEEDGSLGDVLDVQDVRVTAEGEHYRVRQGLNQTRAVEVTTW